MLFYIAVGWLLTSVPAYYLVKRTFTAFTWTNGDCVFWMTTALIFSPAVFIVGILFALPNLASKKIRRWLDQPSKW